MALLLKEREERLFGNIGPPVYAPAIWREEERKITKELHRVERDKERYID